MVLFLQQNTPQKREESPMLTHEIKQTLEQHLHTPVSEVFLTQPVNYPSECIVFHTTRHAQLKKQPFSELVEVSAVDKKNGIYQCFTTPQKLETISQLNALTGH